MCNGRDTATHLQDVPTCKLASGRHDVHRTAGSTSLVSPLVPASRQLLFPAGGPSEGLVSQVAILARVTLKEGEAERYVVGLAPSARVGTEGDRDAPVRRSPLRGRPGGVLGHRDLRRRGRLRGPLCEQGTCRCRAGIAELIAMADITIGETVMHYGIVKLLVLKA